MGYQLETATKVIQPYVKMTDGELFNWVNLTYFQNKNPVFKSIKGICAWIIRQQQLGYDYNCLIIGRRGSGKSTVSYKIAKAHTRLYGGRFNYKDKIVYSGAYDEYLQKYDRLNKGGALVVDEAGKIFFRMDYAKSDVKNIQKMWIADMRKDKKPLHILAVPDASHLMKFWREFETNMIIFCAPRNWFVRPKIIIFELSNIIGKNEIAELIDFLYEMQGMPSSIIRKMRKNRYYSGEFFIKDLLPEERENYLKCRISELDIWENYKKEIEIKLNENSVKTYIALLKIMYELKHQNNYTIDGLYTVAGKVITKEAISKLNSIITKEDVFKSNTKITDEQLKTAQSLLKTLGFSD